MSPITTQKCTSKAICDYHTNSLFGREMSLSFCKLEMCRTSEVSDNAETDLVKLRDIVITH